MGYKLNDNSPVILLWVARKLMVGYLQVNALSKWIIGTYLHEFTNNEREISIPPEYCIENFENEYR